MCQSASYRAPALTQIVRRVTVLPRRRFLGQRANIPGESRASRQGKRQITKHIKYLSSANYPFQDERRHGHSDPGPRMHSKQLYRNILPAAEHQDGQPTKIYIIMHCCPSLVDTPLARCNGSYTYSSGASNIGYSRIPGGNACTASTPWHGVLTSIAPQTTRQPPTSNLPTLLLC